MAVASMTASAVKGGEGLKGASLRDTGRASDMTRDGI